MRLTRDVYGPAGRLAPARRAGPRDIDFQRLVGAAGWARLPVAVRRRFAVHPRVGAPIHYAGVMHTVACTRLGFAVAQLCRLIGTPLAPWPGREVPTDIVLRAEPATRGIAWERLYRYDHGRVLVRSTKRLADDGALLEVVGAGIGMRLAVFERDGALHFRSQRYFWDLGPWFGPWRLPLPDLLTPGVAHVVHTDRGAGRFRFEMTFTHALLGVTFHQIGTFQDQGDVP